METGRTKRPDVPGWGVDLRPENRPGVPMELTPRPAGGAHWTQPEQQPETVKVFRGNARKELTPVFGTTLPPKGLSGVIRGIAYKYPGHYARHWMLLLLGDRVDVLESAIARNAKKLPLLLPVAALAAFAVSRRRAAQRPAWRRLFA